MLTNKFKIIFFSLFSFAAFGQDIDPIEGFRGLQWGISLKEAEKQDMENLVYNIQDRYGKVKVYTSPGDDHSIGTVEVQEIFYYFHDDAGFFKFVIQGGKDQNDEMDAILMNRFGSNFKNFVHEPHAHMIWEINNVVADYREQASEDFILTVKSNQIAEYHTTMNQNIEDF